MKTLLCAIVVLLMVAGGAFGQTKFPQPNENIWLDADKLLYGSVPAQALGTNAPGGSGQVLSSDGSVVYWSGGQSNPVNSLSTSNLTVLNTVQYSTNAFPLSPGSAWNFTKAYQFITTNNDFAITSITGVSNNLINWAVLEVSNSAAATHFCDLSSLPWHIVGSSSTNKVYIGSGKVAVISANLRGFSSSNIVTAVEQ